MHASGISEIDATALETLLAAATAAPSIHNTQPWRFRLDPATGVLQVRAAPQKSLSLTDPEFRAQYLSVGAALFNLRVAVDHLGLQAMVRLLPDPSDPGLLAVVWPCGRSDFLQAGQWRELDLYGAVARRHTSRMPFTGRPVPESVVAQMTEAARLEGARLRVPDFAGTRRLLHLTAAGEARNHADAGRAAESRAWITAPGEGPYGIPVTALGPQDSAGRMPVRDFVGTQRSRRLPGLRFERHAQVALLCTTRDRRVDWLRAGQALQRVLLVATAHGVRTSMLHQALEWPDLRWAMRNGPERRCSPQLLIRFGYGPEGGRTPRAPAQP
jgi:hypothetical protein